MNVSIKYQIYSGLVKMVPMTMSDQRVTVYKSTATSVF